MSYFTDRRSEVAIFFSIWISFFTLLIAAVCALFYRRRKLLPISARPFRTTFAGFVLGFIYVFTASLRYVWFDGHPCLLHLFGNWPLVLALNCYLIRLWILWFNFKFTQEKSKISTSLASSGRNLDADGGWFERHRYLVSNKYLLAFYLCKSVPEGLIMYTPPIYVPGSVDDYFYAGANVFRTTCHTINAAQGWIVVALCFGIELICIFAATKFGEVKDNFFLANEFRIIGWIGAACSVIWVGTRFIPGVPPGPDSYPWLDLSGTLMPTFTMIVIIFVSGAIPTYKTFTMKQNLSKSVSQSESVASAATATSDDEFMPYYATFSEVLETKDGREDFMDHLKLEFSVENLLFWEAIESFRKEFDPEDDHHNRTLALTVVKRFVIDTAPLEVNIDWPSREELVRGVGLRMALSDSGNTSGTGLFAIREGEPVSSVPASVRSESVAAAESSSRKSSHSTSKSFQPEISGQLEIIPLTFFDRAQTRIVRLMARDSFVRFQKKRRDSLSQVQLVSIMKQMSESQIQQAAVNTDDA